MYIVVSLHPCILHQYVVISSRQGPAATLLKQRCFALLTSRQGSSVTRYLDVNFLPWEFLYTCMFVIVIGRKDRKKPVSSREWYGCVYPLLTQACTHTEATLGVYINIDCVISLLLDVEISLVYGCASLNRHTFLACLLARQCISIEPSFSYWSQKWQMTISFIVPTMANQLAACPHWKLVCGASEASWSGVLCSGESGSDLSSLEG